MPDSSSALGIDIGGSSMKLVLMSNDGAVYARQTVPTPGCVDELSASLAHVATGMLSDVPGCAGTGVSVAGLLNRTRDRVAFNPNLAWLEGIPLLDVLGQALPKPVALENDGIAAALGEFRFGAGASARRLLMLVAGTGLGGAVLQNGVPVQLDHGGIGDPGHVMVQPGGPRCSAGCSGCAEALVSIAAMERLARQYRKPWCAREIIELAADGDDTAQAIVIECGRALGIAAATLCAVFQPDMIVVGGGLASADGLLRSAESTMRSTGGPYYVRDVAFRKAILGDLSAAAGAATLALFPLSRQSTER